MITYEDFFSERQIETFKMVKHGQMVLGKTARQVAAGMVGSEVADSGPEVIATRHGLFHLVMSHNSMNSTETYAAQQQKHEVVVMGDPVEMVPWLNRHGIFYQAFERFIDGIRKAL